MAPWSLRQGCGPGPGRVPGFDGAVELAAGTRPVEPRHRAPEARSRTGPAIEDGLARGPGRPGPDLAPSMASTPPPRPGPGTRPRGPGAGSADGLDRDGRRGVRGEGSGDEPARNCIGYGRARCARLDDSISMALMFTPIRWEREGGARG